MSTPTQILFVGIGVAIGALLLSALTDMSFGVIAIFLLGGALFFAFVLNDRSRRGRG
jgi:Flp pilus assembly protein TadB